jgi:hypothetical protein
MNYRLNVMFLTLFLIYGFTQLLFAQEVSWYSKDMGFTSSVHKKYVKQIIWSKSIINFNAQESAKLETKFKLTDPIYGRLFLERSIRNTPVYSSANNKPLENSRNSFEWKLYIDDKDTGGSFGVFYEAYFNDDMGKNWTTWQFSPHPSNLESSEEKEIGAAWEKAVRGLSPGEHSVRFELWGVIGTYRSSEPMTIGTFTLVVSKGERVGTVGKFPKETYSGSDASELGNQLKNALAQKGIAPLAEIRKIAITSDWAYNRYTDTKKEYRKISATVLFSDKDNDGVCRFVTYNFKSDKSGTGWANPRFHSFCNGCPEGDVNCSE